MADMHRLLDPITAVPYLPSTRPAGPALQAAAPPPATSKRQPERLRVLNTPAETIMRTHEH